MKKTLQEELDEANAAKAKAQEKAMENEHQKELAEKESNTKIKVGFFLAWDLCAAVEYNWIPN